MCPPYPTLSLRMSGRQGCWEGGVEVRITRAHPKARKCASQCDSGQGMWQEERRRDGPVMAEALRQA